MKSDLESVPNLGAKSAAMLREAGILNRHQLEKMGPVASFLAVKRVQKNVSLNLLWAIDAGLRNEHWQSMSPHRKAALIRELEDF